MRITIGIKIFGIAVGLLILMAVVALMSMRMTRTVDDQLVIVGAERLAALYQRAAQRLDLSSRVIADEAAMLEGFRNLHGAN